MTDQDLLVAELEACVLETVGGGDGLIISVLGPNPSDDPCQIAGWKRNQIRDVLKTDGHRPFYPEDCIAPDPRGPTMLQRELLLLSSPLVDLVILFHTETGSGTLQEIGKFDSVPEIASKTRILFPFKFFDPGAGNIFSDSLSEYLVKSPYSDDHLSRCRVIYECRKWASVREKELWSLMEPHEF